MGMRLGFMVLGGLALLLAPVPGFSDARDPSGKPDTLTQGSFAETQKLLETLVDTRDFPEEMPLAKFLVALQARLPKGKTLSLRIDEKAFGQDLGRVKDATVRCAHLKNVSLGTVLRRALSQVSRVEEVDYAFRPGALVVTRPRLAAQRMVYDVRDLVGPMPLLIQDWRQDSPEPDPDLRGDDGATLLVRLLCREVSLQPWESVEMLNGARLVVLASPTRHAEVRDLLAMLRRLADVAVVMNARLYEVDRAFFKRWVAPLVAHAGDAAGPPAVVRIDGPLLQRIGRETLLLESEPDKIRPHQEAPFLSRRDAVRYRASASLTRTRLAGVSLLVQPVVSPDCRFLRLRISQKVVQLVGIDKIKSLDLASGKDVEVESPHLRRTMRTGTIDIPDAAPILMPVASRPPGGSADRVWLLVARPFIWIEEEVKEIRRGGGDLTPRSIWDSEVPKDEEPVPAKPLPFNDDVKEVLQGVVTDVLTNPELKDECEFYGTAKDHTVTLVDNEKLGWPKEFRPDTHGYKLVEVRKDPFANRRRILGLRLDKFELKPGDPGPFDAPVQVCLFNAGGSANGPVIGGCTVSYRLRRVGKHWVVEFTSLFGQ